MRSNVEVRLVGGLGNQLFGYYAGAALAAKNGLGIAIDPSWVATGSTTRSPDLRSFDLPGTWLPERPLRWSERPGSLASRALNWAVRSWPLASRIFRHFDSDVVGYDPRLLQVTYATSLSGYFQSWRYAQCAIQNGYPRRPAFTSTSSWLDRTLAEVMTDRPLALHVRRGDYAGLPNYGLLSSSYYVRGLAYLREMGLDGPVWLFSDEPDLAEAELRGVAIDRVIADSDGPASEMLAMSYAAGIVTANSTFSWWAAWMSGLSEEIVSPEPWFRSRGEIPDLIPPTWQRVRASWG